MLASPASPPRPGGSVSALSRRWRWQTYAELRGLWPYLHPSRFRFFGGLACGVVAVGLGLVLPYLIGVMVDATAAGMTPRGLNIARPETNRIGWWVVAVLVTQAGCVCLNLYWVTTAGQRAVAALRGAVFARLVRQRMLFFADQRVGELTTRLMADLGDFGTLLTQTLPLLLRQGLLFVGSTVLLVTASPRLALLMLAIFPPLGITVSLLSRRIRRLQREAQDGLAQVGATATETLSGIATVKAFHQEQREILRYGASQDGYLRSAFRVASVQAGLVAIVLCGMSLAVAAVVWHGVNLVRAGELTGGELTRFVIYTAFMAGGIGLIADRFGAIQRVLGATQRLRALLQQEVEPVGTDTTAATTRWHGEIEFRDVSFAYPSRPEAPVLERFSLRMAAGECLALVGPSGVGKTTVASLLLRFYEPDQGQVLMDGDDLKSYSLAAIRNQVALVPQDVVLFSGTIAENIAYGKSGATSDEIREAAKQSHAHEFISALPSGYETWVGERGVQLSGGQRQRIAIARCILRDPAVLILDEATSALDAESERHLQEALQAAVAGRTTLIIAHRLSTVRMASRIAVLDGGTVVESGSHDELLHRENGAYRRLAALQFAGSNG